jgi:hypothetical protein
MNNLPAWQRFLEVSISGFLNPPFLAGGAESKAVEQNASDEWFLCMVGKR